MAFRTSRTFTSRRRPPRLAGGIIGSINPHSASVRSLGYRSPVRAANRRCSAVHMWCPLQSSAPHIESQPIPLTQQLCGSALTPFGHIEKGNDVAAIGGGIVKDLDRSSRLAIMFCKNRSVGRAGPHLNVVHAPAQPVGAHAI